MTITWLVDASIVVTNVGPLHIRVCSLMVAAVLEVPTLPLKTVWLDLRQTRNTDIIVCLSGAGAHDGGRAGGAVGSSGQTGHLSRRLPAASPNAERQSALRHGVLQGDLVTVSAHCLFGLDCVVKGAILQIHRQLTLVVSWRTLCDGTPPGIMWRKRSRVTQGKRWWRANSVPGWRSQATCGWRLGRRRGWHLLAARSDFLTTPKRLRRWWRLHQQEWMAVN